MAGNHFGSKPQFSRQDASYGHVLLGDGKMGFEWADFNKSGFFIKDEVRHLKSFTDKSGNRYVLAAVNNGTPRVFTYEKQ